MLPELAAAVGQNFYGVQHVCDCNGPHDVEFKVALASGQRHGAVVAHNLYGNHDQRFALGGVDLAGHDGRTGFVFWQLQFGQPAAWPCRQPAHVVGNLDEGHSQPA